MFNPEFKPSNSTTHLDKIDIEDLQYLQQDLCFHELVSLGFLLFGDDRANAEFVLQKLLISTNSGNLSCGDLLHKYATQNSDNWRATIVEALAIIGARRVLRKLGFEWEKVRQHYLPHIAELSCSVHPLLKALYKVCERLTPVQTKTLVLKINEQQHSTEQILRFYDYAYLEVFFLEWITRRIINVGDRKANNANLQVLLQYFKLNDLDELKAMLVGTINFNAKPLNSVESEAVDAEKLQESDDLNHSTCNSNDFTCINAETKENLSNHIQNVETHSEYYSVRREQAGYILIINQRDFHEESNENLKHLLPEKKLIERRGTEVDKEKLENVFSSFGYKPLLFDNLTHIDLLDCIRETVKRSLLLDSIIVCILSHGIDGAVYGSNSIPVMIADIENVITGETLLGKPKLLIIQACQKNEGAKPNLFDKKKTQFNNFIAPNAYTDIIKAMSTVPGYASMRHTETGTWFIQSLCDAVDRLGDKAHLLDILITVTRDVTRKRGDNAEVMVPLTSNTLTKIFSLPRRNSS